VYEVSLGKHAVQFAAPTFEKVPGLQVRHPEIDDVPTLGAYVPAGHDKHEVPEAYEPGEHCVQVPQNSLRIDPEGQASIENDVNSELDWKFE